MTLRYDIAGQQIDGARDYQEDTFLITQLSNKDGDPGALVIVSDGMGGHAAGNVASNLATQGMNKRFTSSYPLDALELIPEMMNLGVMEANIAIQKTVQETPALSGMGCTLVSACFDSNKMWWVSVGDSHLYLIRDRELIKKNADHSYGGFLDRMAAAGNPVEAEAGLSRNMLMSALVGEDIADVDLSDIPLDLIAGDKLVVASDGLDTLSGAMITQLTDWADSPKDCAEALINAVIEADKPRQDNTTVVAIFVKPSKEDEAAAAAAATEAEDDRDPNEITQPRDQVEGAAPVEEHLEREADTEAIEEIFESAPEAPEGSKKPKADLEDIMAAESASEPDAAEAAASSQRDSATGTSGSDQPSGKLIPIIVVLIIIAIALGAGYWFYSGSRTGSVDSEIHDIVSETETPDTESDAGDPQDSSMTDGIDEAVETAPTETVSPTPAVSGKVFRDKLKSGSKGPAMITVMGTSFNMGARSSSANFDERPRHVVKLKGFSISTHEITVAEYKLFTKATGTTLDSTMNSRENYPVVLVSWEDAIGYTKWLSKQSGHHYRLPTEAEWEYAAGAGSTDNYWWGRKIGKDNAHCFGCGSDFDPRKPTRPGRFKPNPLGLYDTAGNVLEWVQDCFHPDYEGAPADGSAWVGGDCSVRIARGGSYSSPPPALRHGKRDKYLANQGNDSVGIRIVRDN